jgi:hypothetical protein
MIRYPLKGWWRLFRKFCLFVETDGTERGDSDEVEYFFRVYLDARRLIGRDEVDNVF